MMEIFIFCMCFSIHSVILSLGRAPSIEHKVSEKKVNQFLCHRLLYCNLRSFKGLDPLLLLMLLRCGPLPYVHPCLKLQYKNYFYHFILWSIEGPSPRDNFVGMHGIQTMHKSKKKDPKVVTK